MSVDNENVGVAFALVIGAGLSTALGASVVFFPRLVKLASRRVLASALGISSGVMTYVSFIEIFQKSVGSFEDSGKSESDAYLYATLCFFGGAVFMLIIDALVRLIGGHGHSHDDDAVQGETDNENVNTEEEVGGQACICSEDPVGDLDRMQKQADELIAENEPQVDNATSTEAEPSIEKPANTKENQKLVKMGINTAVAIGLHNFPEGLATFVAALDDPRVGGVLAIAIGIHNIPEGLCVALPIYYATGNRMKAFLWALLSGASEPIAALLGWAILANSFSDELYAILFGLVAGMMIIISTRELLPTAHRYDPEDTVVTYSFIGGMLIMALSLVLFVL